MAEHTLRVRRGYSDAADARDAVRELREAIHAPNEVVVFVFASPRYDRVALAQALHEAFEVPIAACTSAGELTPSGYATGGLVGLSVTSPRMVVDQVLIEDAKAFDGAAADRLSGRLLQVEAAARKRLPTAKSVGVLLIDGLCGAEEQVAGNLHIATHGMPLVGASAGDGLVLGDTGVYWDGEFVSGGAVLTVMATTHPFEIAHTRRRGRGEEKLVVTAADPARRRVTEFNGKPAAREYAQLLGLTPDDLVPAAFARRPLVTQIGRESFVRGVVRADGDQLQFSCAVDSGMVLSVSRDEDLVASLSDCLSRALRAVPEPALVLGFEGVLRKLALRENEQTEAAEALLRDHGAIGFHGYGEQVNALHLNQTFTTLVVGE